MTPENIRTLLENVRAGTHTVDQALDALKSLPFGDLGYAKVDHHRALRLGLPEVVFAQGKTSAQLVGILRELVEHGQTALATRVTPEQAKAVALALPDTKYDPVSRIAIHQRTAPAKRGRGRIAVLCAGTSDLPVAEEAAMVASAFGNDVDRYIDVGVAGLHRLLSQIDAIRRASVVIVVAGMEGALPSVVAGLVDKPVIAVPSSVGYGASFNGLAALLGMLNSCGSGVMVVNIDNGFGAAVAATLINRQD